MFRRVFIANRGEVAVRIAKACDELGIEPVFGVSLADQVAPYLAGREHVVLGPPRPSDSYLCLDRVVQAARQTRCSAVHPGWGFLSENAVFASLCRSHGLTFIGPPPALIALLGQKSAARRVVAAHGLSVVPGSDCVRDAADAQAQAAELGYPVMLKADDGGGGRGMRVVRDDDDLVVAYAEAAREAQASFGSATLYLEKLFERTRHIEVQILVDRYGQAIHVGERDCSVQRKHQKLIEESPSVVLSEDERQRVLTGAVRVAARLGYVGAGTFEFLLDGEGTLHFIEMNARLQVEHGVSEMRSGLDIVAEQIRIAAGHPLSVSQQEVHLIGHVLECRINAEDPADDFRPTPGTIADFSLPPEVAGETRFDTHVTPGYVVEPFYDSMLCKALTAGPTREEAIDRMVEVLRAIQCEGVATTIPVHLAVLQSEAFRSSNYHTAAIPGWGD